MAAVLPVSYLFAPGHRPDRFDKALGAGADVVILDLEDAVPPTEKTAARDAVANWLSADKPVALRVNSSDSPLFADDIALCAHPGVMAVVLPKAATLDELAQLRAAGARRLLPLIETGAGFANATALAGGTGVDRLLFGSIDFSVDLGIEGDERELDYFRSQLVLASRLANAQPPVDGVTTAIDDTAVLERETLRGKRFGFGGKLCIHPRQLAVVHAAYLPSDAEVDWAHRVLTAAAAAKGGAVAVDGKMVDKPVIIKAERIVQQTMRQRS